MYKILFSIAAVMIFAVVGCSKDDHASMMTNSTSPKITVTPGDGATNVRLDEGIAFTFEKPVDRGTTERNIHLFSEKDMADSTCPMSTMMGHGMMDSAMTDSMTMNHLISRHSTHGHFQWNSDSTLCTFRPDSMMMAGMRYMIHVGREMMQMMEDRMGNMGMMAGHGSGMMSRDVMYHFQTMPATGGGHDDHH